MAFVDEQALISAGGRLLASSTGIAIAGWTIESNKAPITKDADMDTVRAAVCGARSLPEQLHGDNYLQLRHDKSGFSLAFRALDALQSWQRAKVPPVQVAHAEGWKRSREADVQANRAVTLAYDWTFTTPYTGTCSYREVAEEASSLCGEETSTSGRESRWTASQHPIDKAVLMARDPILFYDDVPLYESELDDNGASQLSVKVRVMPKCWFVLLRFWLRVDRVMVRLWETRILCRFEDNPPILTREMRRSEGTTAELAKAGAPSGLDAYIDAEASATVLQAVAPVGVTMYETEELTFQDQAVLAQ